MNDSSKSTSEPQAETTDLRLLLLLIVRLPVALIRGRGRLARLYAKSIRRLVAA